jgi:hypothetical protein
VAKDWAFGLDHGRGLTHVPRFSRNLKTWSQPTQAADFIRTDEVWERCMVDDREFTSVPAVRFGRVSVSK